VSAKLIEYRSLDREDPPIGIVGGVGAGEDVECFLEIAIVCQRSPITSKKRLVAGVSNRGLLEHRDRLGPLPRSPERLTVLQRRVGILGVGTKAITIKFYLAPGIGNTVWFGFITQRPRDIRSTGGLAATKPQRQKHRQYRERKTSRGAIALEQLRQHLL